MSRLTRWRSLLALVASMACGAAAKADDRAGVAPVARVSSAVDVSIPFEKYTLANGLEVILHEDRRVPVVAVNVWYHVGSKDESAGKTGLAHLFEHMMFQGSRHVGEGMFSRYLDAVGATEHNATTNTDRTTYFETVPRGRLELALWLESDRMAFLLDGLSQARLDNQRKVVLQEKNERYDNTPYGLVAEHVRRAIYPAEHPYAHLSIGSERDLEAATLDDARAFFKASYAPGNATLVIAGDVAKGDARELVERYFGPIARGAGPRARPKPTPVKLDAEQRLAIEANVELARVYVSWPTVEIFGEGDAELSLLSLVLAQGRVGRLSQRLSHEQGLVQSVAARQGSAQLGSVFEIVASVKPGVAPERVLQAIDAELAALRTAGPTDDELERAKAHTITQLVMASERVTSRANLLNLYNHFALDPGFAPRDVQRYQAVTRASMKEAASRQLRERGRVVSIVSPTPSAPVSGALRGAR